MKTYSVQERIDMILSIGECHENCLLASRVYAQRYPGRNHPTKRVFERLLETFRRTGSVAYEKSNRQSSVTGNEENEFQVVGSIIENPHVSQRQISHQTALSRQSIARIIKKHKFHPYHIQLHQQLSDADFNRRLDFCLWALDMLGNNENFFNYVLFTDESTFHSNGLVNRHNFHYYSDHNPHFFRSIDNQNRWSINVWGGILGSRIIGPYFFDENLNGQRFLSFLRDELHQLLEDVPLNDRRQMWLQLDGAPAHFQIRVRRELNRSFPNKWIGRGSPHNWPARSPDLTSLDFFLWGYVKNIVYDAPPTTKDDMKRRIQNAFHSITPQVLLNVRQSFERRLQLCIEENGRQFEHLM